MSKFKKNNRGAEWHTITVVSVDEIIHYSTGSTKNIFTGKGLKEPRQSVYWGNIDLNEGDKLQVQGWITKDGLFLCKQLLRIERANV